MPVQSPETQFPDTLFAARLHDSVVGFLECTLREPDVELDPEIVLCRFAEALRRFLVRVPIKVVWQDDFGSTSASCTHMVEPAQTSEDIETEQHLLFGKPLRSQSYPPISISWHPIENDTAEVLRLSWCTEGPGNYGYLWLNVPGADSDKKWSELCLCIPALKLLFLTLAMPLSLYRTGRRLRDLEREYETVARLRAGARYLSSARFASVPDRLERTVPWIEGLAASTSETSLPVASLLLAENLDVLVSLLQQLLATGWTDRMLDSQGPGSPVSLLNRITGYALGPEESAEQKSGPHTPPAGSLHDDVVKQHFELERVAEALHAVLTRRPVTVTPDRIADNRCELLRVLPFWVGLQEPFRDACSDDARGLAARSVMAKHDTSELVSLIRFVITQADASLEHSVFDVECVPNALDTTKATLANHLALGWSDSGDHGESGLFTDWLHLWLGLEILEAISRQDGLAGLLDGQCLKLAADMGYVIREGVRKALYRNRQDYSYQPETYLAALCTLVEYHARTVGSIQREYNVHSLLDDIGQSYGPDRSCSPTEHLQHVLDVYLIGHYLLSCKFDTPSSVTVADRLAGQFEEAAGSNDLIKLLRAFSIAALAHDYGYLLYPSRLWSHSSLQHAKQHLPSQLVARCSLV